MNAERRYADAREATSRAIAIFTEALGADDVRLHYPITGLANVYLALGDYAQAKALNERAIAIVEKAAGPTPLVTPNLNNLGGACFEGGDYDCAISAFRRAHALYEKSYGKKFFGTAVTLSNLAEALRAKGQADRALPLDEEAVATIESMFGKDEPNLAALVVGLAETQRALGNTAQARATFGRALALEEKALGHDHADLAAPLTGIGETYLDEGKGELARAPLTRALALREASAGDPFARGETRFALARALPRSAVERARGLAVKARAELVSAGPRGVARAADVTQWLARR